jgi:hypothetical protein
MKTTKIAVLLITAFLSLNVLANSRTGNGSFRGRLEGFDDYQKESQKLVRAIERSETILSEVDYEESAFLSLRTLRREILEAKYIKINKTMVAVPKRHPGDYLWAGELAASTDAFPGAPTRIYKNVIEDMSETQLVQMVIHEALHRSLSSPYNTYEPVVERITNILTQYTNPEFFRIVDQFS